MLIRHLSKISFLLSLFFCQAVAAEPIAKSVGIATARVVKQKTEIDGTSRDQMTFEIPLDNLGIVSGNDDNRVLLNGKDGGRVSFSISSESNSIVNISLGLADGKSGSEKNKPLEIELKNDKGVKIKARVSLEGNSVVFDKNGQAKLQVKLELAPGSAKLDDGPYRAFYSINIEH